CKLSCDVKESFTNRESTLDLMDITSIRLVALWIPFVKLPDKGCDLVNCVTTSGLLYSFFQTVFESTVQHIERTIIPTMIKTIDLEVCWSPAFAKAIFSRSISNIFFISGNLLLYLLYLYFQEFSISRL